MKPGIYEMSAAEYQADPCESASLSHSVAKRLLDESPAHARKLHPRLNGGHLPPRKRAFDMGTLLHSLFLEGDDVSVRVNAENYLTKAAKQERDAAYEAGKIPLTRAKADKADKAESALRRSLGRLSDPKPPFTAGRAEMTLIWRESNGIWCRARPDWLRHDGTYMDDLKIVASANPGTGPGQFGRAVFAFGHDIQAAFYLRGLRALGKEARFRFVAFELRQHECTMAVLSSAALAVANAKVEKAIRVWGECMDSGEWPGYPRRSVEIDVPAFEVARWEQEAAEEEGF